MDDTLKADEHVDLSPHSNISCDELVVPPAIARCPRHHEVGAVARGQHPQRYKRNDEDDVRKTSHQFKTGNYVEKPRIHDGEESEHSEDNECSVLTSVLVIRSIDLDCRPDRHCSAINGQGKKRDISQLWTPNLDPCHDLSHAWWCEVVYQILWPSESIVMSTKYLLESSKFGIVPTNMGCVG